MKYYRYNRCVLIWRFYLALTLCIAYECPGRAQKLGQALADSLQQTFPGIKEDTLKIKVLYRLAYVYSNIKTQKGLEYGMEGLKFAHKLAWKKGIAWSYNNIGINYMVGGAYDKALLYYDSALSVFELLGNEGDLAPATCNIGITYQYMGDYAQALEYYEKALKIDEKIGNKTGAAIVMGNIGWVYQVIGDYSNSLDFFLKALKIDEDAGDKQNIAITTGNIGNVYRDLGNYPMALEYYLKALKIHDAVGHKLGMSVVIGDIGGTYQKLNNNQTALEYYLKALAIDSEIGSREGVAAMQVAIGGLYLSVGNYSDAISNSEKGLRVADEIGDKVEAAWALKNIGSVYLNLAKESDGIRNRTKIAGTRKQQTDPLYFSRSKTELLHLAFSFIEKAVNSAKRLNAKDLLVEGYKELVEVNKLLGDYRSAMDCYENYAIIKDSLFSAEKEKKITRLEVTYEFGKREDSIKLATDQKEKAISVQLKLQRIYTYAGIGGVIALLAFTTVLAFYFSQRVWLQRLLAAEKIRNKVAADLHDDVGSSLSSIALMSELARNQPLQTANYLARIGDTSQNVIEKMNDIVWAINPDNDSIEQILARMQHFASSLLEKKNIALKFDAAPEMAGLKLDMEARKNFYLIFKETIHNAFKYAACSDVTATLRSEGNAVSMRISDNGKGFDTGKELAGNGLANLKKRASALNGQLEITSAPGSGTTVCLTFKTTHTGS